MKALFDDKKQYVNDFSIGADFIMRKSRKLFPGKLFPVQFKLFPHGPLL